MSQIEERKKRKMFIEGGLSFHFFLDISRCFSRSIWFSVVFIKERRIECVNSAEYQWKMKAEETLMWGLGRCGAYLKVSLNVVNLSSAKTNKREEGKERVPGNTGVESLRRVSVSRFALSLVIRLGGDVQSNLLNALQFSLEGLQTSPGGDLKFLRFVFLHFVGERNASGKITTCIWNSEHM